MALGPKDLKLTKDELAEVQRIEKMLDNKLKETSGTVLFRATIGYKCSERIATAVLALYRDPEIGWGKVEIEDNNTFIFTPPR